MKKPYLSAITAGLAIIAALVSAGCQAPAPHAAPHVTLRCRIPTVTALPETKEAQEKGGVEIAIVPVAHKAVRRERLVMRETQPPFLSLVIVPQAERSQKVYVEQTTSPYLEPDPPRLQFTVRINNKLSRVFRGQGAVVQMNVGGKMIPFGNIDYKEFLNGIVPPRNEAEFTIYGPTLDLLPDKGTIGIFLYDVVTATDVAGNTTEKQNYEWYFDCQAKTEEATGEVRTTQGFIDVAAYQQQLVKQQQEQARYGLASEV